MHFGKFVIPQSHIFYRTKLSGAFVNLRPIVPGHVLVIPERVTPHLYDLNEEEYHDLWSSVRVVQTILQRHYSATAFNVAVQDGRAAGQSVPHVHVHILPRFDHDLERNDDVYDMLDEWAPRQELAKNKSKLNVPDDSSRKDRTTEQMAQEAESYRKLLT
jgi:bis(5'-adenosyl)-triphosphatase